jgi:hypothetical protein
MSKQAKKSPKPNILAPIIDEWWQKGDMVAASKQHEEDVKKAVYVGVWIAMGLLSRTSKMGETMHKGFIQKLHDECKAKIYHKDVKVVASINGASINN